MDMTLRGIANLLEEIETMREDVAAFDRTRRNMEKAMKDMEEQAMLEEILREEFAFEEEELELEGKGATDTLQEGGNVGHSGDCEKQMKDMKRTVSAEKMVKEDATIEDELMPNKQIEEGSEMLMEMNDDLI